MRDYYSNKPKGNPHSSPNSIEYSIGLLEKALGFVKVFGLTNIPPGVKSVLDYAIRVGDLSPKKLELADLNYHQKYERKSS